MKIFISIPMTGIENSVIKRFKEVESFIKNNSTLSQYEIVTPYKMFDVFDEHGLKEGYSNDLETTAFCMGKDVELVIGCDAIFSCSGWENSKGCRVERATAEIYGLKLFNQ